MVGVPNSCNFGALWRHGSGMWSLAIVKPLKSSRIQEIQNSIDIDEEQFLGELQNFSQGGRFA